MFDAILTFSPRMGACINTDEGLMAADVGGHSISLYRTQPGGERHEKIRHSCHVPCRGTL